MKTNANLPTPPEPDSVFYKNPSPDKYKRLKILAYGLVALVMLLGLALIILGVLAL